MKKLIALATAAISALGFASGAYAQAATDTLSLTLSGTVSSYLSIGSGTVTKGAAQGSISSTTGNQGAKAATLTLTNFVSGAGALNSFDSKYPPAEPGALELEPLEAADGVANAAPKFSAT